MRYGEHEIQTEDTPNGHQWLTNRNLKVSGQIQLGPEQEFGIYMPYEHPLDHCKYLDCICLGSQTPEHNVKIQGHPKTVTMLKDDLGGIVTAWSGNRWNQRILIAIEPSPELLDFVLKYQNYCWSDGHLYADLTTCKANLEPFHTIRLTEYDLYQQVLYVPSRRIKNLAIVNQ